MQREEYINGEKITFALYFGNRGFFPGELIADARKELAKALVDAGHDYIMPEESIGRYGAVETIEEGKRYAAFLDENRGKYQGVILSSPISATKTERWRRWKIAAFRFW